MTASSEMRTKPPGRCIFCGGTGLTKEHIWSNWLSRLISKNDQHGDSWGKIEKQAGTGEFEWTVPTTSGTRQGCVLQRKIRKVCGACNNGWMSQIVEDSKPIVERMILGESFCLSEADQTSLAAWIGITTIVQEFANRQGAQRILAADRSFLKDNLMPPPTWSIWIAAYTGDWWQPMGHHHIPMTYNIPRTEQMPDPPSGQLQLTTFILGSMLVHVFTATQKEMVESYCEYIAGASTPRMLPQAWPMQGGNITWPPDAAFGDDDVDRLAFSWMENKWGVQGISNRDEQKTHEALQRIKEVLDAVLVQRELESQPLGVSK